MSATPVAPEYDTDVVVSGLGTVYPFALLTDEARTWVNDNVSEDRQMLGLSVAVEHRYVGPLIEGMERDGLVVDTAELQAGR